MLRLLDGDRAGLDQPLVPVVFLLCESERRLRLRGLLLGLLDACLLRRDLRFDAGDARLRLAHLRLGLIDLSPVVAVVEPQQHRARLDQLVVRHRDIDDGGADLGADRNGACVDESVVGQFVGNGVDPPEDGRGHHHDDQRR